MMEFQTIDEWDEAVWLQAAPIYQQAFPEKGTKSKNMFRLMFVKKLCFLHLAILDSKAVAMAITFHHVQSNTLIIDYMAVNASSRNQGVGQLFVLYLQNWALSVQNYNGIIIEVETESAQNSSNRHSFWLICGFVLTPYIHSYIWVPETYQAMYYTLNPLNPLPTDGQTLFKYITQIHEMAYRGK